MIAGTRYVMKMRDPDVLGAGQPEPGQRVARRHRGQERDERDPREIVMVLTIQ